jgi:RNA polymerase sigma-70 factor (ECF subfamily)
MPTGAPWFEPLPDALLDDVCDGSAAPCARDEADETIALAYVAALQQLPPRQRAALVLREALNFGIAEIADTLDSSVASVDSVLRRARATLDARLPCGRERAPQPRSAAERRLAGRFAVALQAGAIDDVVALLTDDAIVAMPPAPDEYQGHAAIGELMRTRCAISAGRVRLIATRANRQPAFGCYLIDAHAPLARACGLIVLTLEGERISAITGFARPVLFARFGLPRVVSL